MDDADRLRERIHDPILSMLDGMGIDVDVQYASGRDYIPVINVEPLITNGNINGGLTASLIRCGKPIFDFCRVNVKFLNDTGLCRAIWFPIRWTAGLQKWTDMVKTQTRDIEILAIDTATPRRRSIYDSIRSMGYNVTVISGVFGDEATALIKRSKILLCVHRASSDQSQAQLRLAWAFCSGTVVVAESSIKPSFTGFFIESDYASIADCAVSALKNWSEDQATEQLEDFKTYSEVLENHPLMKSIKCKKQH